MLPTAYETDSYKSLKTAVEILIIVANSLFFLFAIITAIAFYKFFRMNNKSKMNRQQQFTNIAMNDMKNNGARTRDVVYDE